jgi:hypothetical protein
MRVASQRSLNYRRLLQERRRLREEKLRNSIDKWVLGKEVTSSNVHTLQQYKNLLLTRLRYKMRPKKKTKAQKIRIAEQKRIRMAGVPPLALG